MTDATSVGLKLQRIAIATFSTIHTFYIFTALHGMQTRSSDKNSVCPSVRLSNASACIQPASALLRIEGIPAWNVQSLFTVNEKKLL